MGNHYILSISSPYIKGTCSGLLERKQPPILISQEKKDRTEVISVSLFVGPNKKVFIDESYIYQNHVSSYGLIIASKPIMKPSGKGKRAVMIGAILRGWLEYLHERRTSLAFTEDDTIYKNGSIKFWIENVGADYHRNFTSEIFLEYLKNDVFPYLTEQSLIIIDRASYHFTFPDETFYPKKNYKTRN